MSGVLEERYGVSVTGVSWDAGPFKLWGAQSADVVLFSPKQPMLARSLTTGRYEAACTQYRVQADDTYKIVGGGAAFTVTTALQFDEAAMQTLKDQWRTMLAGQPDAPQNPTFVPLNTRKATTELAIPTIAGTVSDLTAKANDAGTPGGTISYMVDLTAAGAQEWGEAMRSGRSPVAQVMLDYEYLRYMPACSVDIAIDGKRVFEHFSAELKASYDGWLYGGSVDIQAQFESLRTDGSIVMTFAGLDDLPAGMEKIKESVINTIVDQGMKAMLAMLFQPKPDVKPAAAGDSGGLFGGANLALKWQRSDQAMNLHSKLEFGGFTWLTERADADLSMFSVLDDSYVTTVNTELQFPASITVIGDPQVAATAVSWNPSEGQAPKSPVFDAQGGSQTYIVTSKAPDAVNIDWTAKIDYAPSQWPIVTTSGHGAVKDGLGNVLIKPSQWIGSTTIYLYVKDATGKGIALLGSQASGSDYLVVNVSYEAANLSQAIKASTRLTEDTPITFSYPIDPAGTPGTAKFSAFGIIGGKLQHAAEQPISLDESAVFILVSDAGIQLVSANAILTESDTVAQDLLARRDRVVKTGDGSAPSAGKAAETTRAVASGRVQGTLVAVEYTSDGAAVLVESNGGQVHIHLADPDLAARFREQEPVDIETDANGNATKITVPLPH